MGTQRPRKRNFFYPTIDPRAIPPLLAHVPAGTRFAEPCAGAGDLVQLLENAGLVCEWGLELEPQGSCLRNRWPIGVGDALGLTAADLGDATVFIGNLPWERGWLHPLIKHLAAIAALWSLHDASWAYTRQAVPFRPLLTDIAAVGRLKWFEGSKYDPPDDCAWYRFDAAKADPSAPPRFHLPVPRGPDTAGGAPRDSQLALI
jgi:hypothetical protein